MSANIFIPVNLRVTQLYNNGAKVEWNLGNTALSQLKDLKNFIVEGQSVTSGLFVQLGTTPETSFIIPSGYSAVRVSADTTYGVSSTAVLSLATTNLAEVSRLGAIGIDDSGNPRLLSVNENGVLRVTGATITNTGGDAAASHQITQTGLLNTLSTKTDTLASKLDTLNTTVSSITIDPSNVAALKNITVTNFPSDYPDAAVASLLSNLNTSVAKNSVLNSILTQSLAALKTADLSFSGDSLETAVTNLPLDYPDAAANAKLTNINSAINTGNASLVGIKNDSASLVMGLNSANTTLNTLLSTCTIELSKSDTIISEIGSSNTLLSSIEGHVYANSSVIADIRSNTTGLFKPGDLPVTGLGHVAVSVQNHLMDYPDAAANAKLTTIANTLTTMLGGFPVNISTELPAGNNAIGSVEVSGSALPNGAATEATLHEIQEAIADIENKYIGLDESLDAIRISSQFTREKVEEEFERPREIYNQSVSFDTSSHTITPEPAIYSELLTKYRKYYVQVFAYEAPISAEIGYLTAPGDTQTFHLEVASGGSMSVPQNTVGTRQLLVARNIAIKLKGVAGNTKNALIKIFGMN